MMKHFYLLAALIGTILPYIFFIDFIQTHGFSLITFATSLYSNGASGGLSTDLFISSLVFWAYLFSRKESAIWLYVALNVFIGLSCALPAYLYAREREKEAQEMRSGIA